ERAGEAGMHAPMIDVAVEDAATGHRYVGRDAVAGIGDHAGKNASLSRNNRLVEVLEADSERQAVAEVGSDLDHDPAVIEVVVDGGVRIAADVTDRPLDAGVDILS